MWDEVRCELEGVWGGDTEQWYVFLLDDTIRCFVARESNRILAGQVLCRSNFFQMARC